MRILQSGAFVVLLCACGGDPPKPEAKIEEEAWFPEDSEAAVDEDPVVDEVPTASPDAVTAPGVPAAALADAAAVMAPAMLSDAPLPVEPLEAPAADPSPAPEEDPPAPAPARPKKSSPASEAAADPPKPAAPDPVPEPVAVDPAPAPVAETPAPAPAPKPKPKPTPAQRLTGDYHFAGGSSQRSKVADAVEAVVSEMNVMSRGVARRRLLDSSEPAKSMKVRIDGQSVRVAFDGRSYEATLGGASVRVTGPSGDPLDFKVRMRDEQLMLSFSGGKGGKKYVLRPASDDRVQMRVTIHSDSLPKSVVYQLTYRRS